MAETSHIIPRGNPIASEKIASDNTNKTLTAATYAPSEGVATGAIIQVITNAVRYNITGKAADHADGDAIAAAVGDIIVLTSTEQIRKFKFSRVAADGAIIVQYVR